MKEELSKNDKDALEYFLRKGKTPDYINKITTLPVDVILRYARELSLDLRPNPDLRNRALIQWTKYKKERLPKYDCNNYHYRFIREAFVSGYMMSHW